MPRAKKQANKAPTSPKDAISRLKYLGDTIAVLEVLVERLSGSLLDETGERKYPEILSNTFGDKPVSEEVIDEVMLFLEEKAKGAKEEMDALWR